MSNHTDSILSIIDAELPEYRDVPEVPISEHPVVNMIIKTTKAEAPDLIWQHFGADAEIIMLGDQYPDFTYAHEIHAVVRVFGMDEGEMLWLAGEWFRSDLNKSAPFPNGALLYYRKV